MKIARTCEKCGGPLSAAAKYGICNNTPDCLAASRSAAGKSRRTGHLNGEQIPAKVKTKLLPPAYDLDDGTEIVDHIAIWITVQGTRVVRLTEREQLEAVGQMLQLCYGWQKIAHHLGILPKAVVPLIEHFGYELVPDRLVTSGNPNNRVIVRKDRELPSARSEELLGTRGKRGRIEP